MLHVRRVPAWRSATIGVDGPDSYTAFGFANPTRRVLASVLHTHTEVSVLITEGNGQHADGTGGAPGVPGAPDGTPLAVADRDPEPDGGAGEVRELEAHSGGPHLGYRSDVIEVVETYLYRPAFRLVAVVVTTAKRLQSGRLDAYLLYMLIALIAVLAVVTALA